MIDKTGPDRIGRLEASSLELETLLPTLRSILNPNGDTND